MPDRVIPHPALHAARVASEAVTFDNAERRGYSPGTGSPPVVTQSAAHGEPARTGNERPGYPERPGVDYLGAVTLPADTVARLRDLLNDRRSAWLAGTSRDWERAVINIANIVEELL